MSLGVVIAGVVIMAKGWLWVDPVISLVIVVVILVGTWVLLRESINHAMDAVPERIDIASLKRYLTGLDNVSDIHDLHVWPLSTTEIALTVHLVVSDDTLNNAFLREVQQVMRDRFGIAHATLQVERQDIEHNGCLLNRQRCI